MTSTKIHKRSLPVVMVTVLALAGAADVSGAAGECTHAQVEETSIVRPQSVQQIEDRTTVAFDLEEEGVDPSKTKPLEHGKRLNVVSDLELLDRFIDPATAGAPWIIQRLTERTYFIELAFHSVTAFVGDHGVLVVDAPNVMPPLPPLFVGDGERLIQAVRSITEKPITRLVYTHPHQDHVGGANRLKQTLGDGFKIIGTKWLERSIRRYGLPLPEPDIVIRDRVATLAFEDNPEFTFRIITPEPVAHTSADSYIITPDRVLHVTDIIHPMRFPSAVNGGVMSQEGWVRMLRYVAGEKDNYDFINPGHENVAYFEDVQLTIDYFEALYGKWWELTSYRPADSTAAARDSSRAPSNSIMEFITVDGVPQDNTIVWLQNYWDAMAERMLVGNPPVRGVLHQHPRFNRVPNIEAARDHAAAVNDSTYLNRYSPTGPPNVPSFEPLPPPRSCADLGLDDCG